MSFRPAGWFGLAGTALENIKKDEYGWIRKATEGEKEAFEAGADAMLKMLRANGNSDILLFLHAVVNIRPLETIGKGKFLFIPDEEEEDACLRLSQTDKRAR